MKEVRHKRKTPYCMTPFIWISQVGNSIKTLALAGAGGGGRGVGGDCLMVLFPFSDGNRR